ncbi:MAG: hypothetical protein A2X94_14815 [Bdellovibrionales bacterium GWB1_55_8]|nr:MAG: hypothetical protein A2X94_14815 [Bdellovibrionales bacterium GWB1_55_8]
MCVLFLAYRVVPEFPFVFAMNRDELHARPTAPASFWPVAAGLPENEILAGRDLEAGGTWMGVTRHGRFAALSNFRDPKHQKAHPRSRGEIVRDFLSQGVAPSEFLDSLQLRASEYNDFNFLCGVWGKAEEFRYYSSRARKQQLLEPGIYGLSNAYLDTPWPKVVRGKKAFELLLQGLSGNPSREEWTKALFAFLRNSHCADDAELPDTGVGLAAERALSSIFIEPIRLSSGAYGTVSSSVILFDSSGFATFEERSLSLRPSRCVAHEFKILS